MENNDLGLGNMEKKRIRKEDFHKYIVISVTTIVTFFICILLFFFIYRYSGVAEGWSKLMQILQPFIIGIALAYLLNPIMMFVENNMTKLLKNKVKNPERLKKPVRWLGIISAILFLFLVIFLLLEMLIPQLIESINGVVKTAPDEINNFIQWLDQYLQKDSPVVKMMESGIVDASESIGNWVQEKLISQANTYIVSITTGVWSFAKGIMNVFVGLIVSVYLLAGKERFIGQLKKVIYTLCSAKSGNAIIRMARRSNEIFGGFISGKLIDSLIIGLLCYIGLSVLNMPYAMLVSVIVGVTNVIPFFGPYIGAVPSTIIIALANPIKGLYFVIFILVLQQLDGNVIGPKILGDSTGLSAFWVIFAILLAGGLFGFIGMLLGVPTFAVIYNIVSEFIHAHLAKKRLPQDTESYIELEEVIERQDKKEIAYMKK